MACYMIRAKFSQDAVKKLIAKPENRKEIVGKALKAAGGKLHDYFFAFGEYDAVVICEFPSNTDAAAVLMGIMGSGSLSAINTTPLLTMEEAVEAMGNASQLAKLYKAPGA